MDDATEVTLAWRRGGGFVVDAVFVSSDGFLAVHEANPFEGWCGWIASHIQTGRLIAVFPTKDQAVAFCHDVAALDWDFTGKGSASLVAPVASAAEKNGATYYSASRA